MRYFTFKKAALAAKKAWQTLRFKAGKGYYLYGEPPPAPTTMYDSINLTQIPADAEAVAGYVGGRWPTFPQLAKAFPAARRVSIAVAANQNADCLDVERGDAEIVDAARWVDRQLARGVKRPIVYTSLSQAQQLLNFLAFHGIRRDQIRFWTAHYTYKPHRCSGACGFDFNGVADATQYTDHALGKNLDASLLAPDFFE